MKNWISIFAFSLVGFIAAALAVINFSVWNQPVKLDSSKLMVSKDNLANTWAPPLQEKQQASTTKKTKQQYIHLLNRPLFSPTRRLTAKTKPKKPKKAKRAKKLHSVQEIFDPKKLKVRGILVSGAKVMVLVSASGKDNGRWLSVGEKIKTWTITKIGDGFVELKSGHRLIHKPLYVEKSQ